MREELRNGDCLGRSPGGGMDIFKWIRAELYEGDEVSIHVVRYQNIINFRLNETQIMKSKTEYATKIFNTQRNITPMRSTHKGSIWHHTSNVLIGPTGWKGRA